MSQSDWKGFEHKWDLYVHFTNMLESQVAVQLWVTVSEGVSKCLVLQGLTSQTTALDLTKTIKEVCVRGHNKHVEQMTFFDMAHTAGEHLSNS